MSDETPAGFKMTELGPMPRRWAACKVGDVFEFSRRPRSLRVDAEGKIPFLSMDVVPENGDRIRTWTEKTPGQISTGTFVLKGDLIIAKITPSFENGKQAILDNLPGEFAYATTEVWALHPRTNNVLPRFLANFLRIDSVRRDLASKMEGSTGRQRLPRHVVQNLRMPLPPLPEQKAIARILSAIQDSKEKTDAVIEAAKGLKKSLMKHLFTYGPVPPAEAEKVVMKETEIGDIPDSWTTADLGAIADLFQYGTSKRCEGDAAGLPVLRIPNVVGGEINCSDLKYTDLPEKDVEKLRLKNGDILFVRTNGRREYVGRSAVYHQTPSEALFASYLIRVRVKRELALPDFIQIYSMTEKGKQFFSGRATGAADGKFNINTQILRKATICLPKPPVQEQIVSILAGVNLKIQVEQDRRKGLDQLFKTMLRDLMTARIRVKQIKEVIA